MAGPLIGPSRNRSRLACLNPSFAAAARRLRFTCCRMAPPMLESLIRRTAIPSHLLTLAPPKDLSSA